MQKDLVESFGVAWTVYDFVDRMNDYRMKMKVNSAATQLGEATNTILIICYIALFFMDRGYMAGLKVPVTVIVAINTLLTLLYLFLLIKNRFGAESLGLKIFFASATLIGGLFLLYLYISLL